MNDRNVLLAMDGRRRVTLCNHNFSLEGILHPDRIMDEYDLLFMQDGEWDIIEEDMDDFAKDNMDEDTEEPYGGPGAEGCGGELTQGIGKHTYHLSPGSVLLLEPGKHHYSVEKCSPMMRNVYIHFSVDDGDISSNGLQYGAGSVLPEKVLAIPKLVKTEDSKEIHHAFERVVDAFWAHDKEETKELRCSMYFDNLLLKLADLGTVNRRTDILVSEIIHRFHCEPEKFLSPDTLAKNYGMSVRTIARRFKEQTGMSIHQYQLRIKLEMAYDLLPISPGRSLHDIAISYGFYDEFQFSKLFKRQFGISPSERR